MEHSVDDMGRVGVVTKGVLARVANAVQSKEGKSLIVGL